METKLIRRAVELWTSPFATREQNRYNQRQWLRSVLRLGDKWLLANQQPRLDNAKK